jgi:hypothetical protein
MPQGRRRYPARHRHEVRGQPERQVRLEQEGDGPDLRDRGRQVRPDDAGDREREQDDHRAEDQDQIAVDDPGLPDVLDEDDDEDGDECELQRDVDGVHGSLDANDAIRRPPYDGFPTDHIGRRLGRG